MITWCWCGRRERAGLSRFQPTSERKLVFLATLYLTSANTDSELGMCLGNVQNNLNALFFLILTPT